MCKKTTHVSNPREKKKSFYDRTSFHIFFQFIFLTLISISTITDAASLIKGKTLIKKNNTDEFVNHNEKLKEDEHFPPIGSSITTVLKQKQYKGLQKENSLNIRNDENISRSLQNPFGNFLNGIFGNEEEVKEPSIFDGLNDILLQSRFFIPDLYIDDLPFPFPESAGIRTYNFICFDIQLEEIKDTIEYLSENIAIYNIQISDLAVTCDFDWNYIRGSSVDDDGKGKVYTEKGDIELEVFVMSEPFVIDDSNNDIELYPTSAKRKSCTTSVDVTDMDFTGGFRAGLVNAIESFLRGSVSSQIEDAICDALESSATSGLTDLLNSTIESFKPYLNELNLNDIDPLAAQNDAVIPDGAQIIDFQHGALFNRVSGFIDDLFGKAVFDPSNKTEKSEDLGINIFLRANVLDENRTVNIPTNSIDDIIILDSKDPGAMFHIILTIESLKIIGFDTFTEFSVLKAIAPHTIRNNCLLEEIEIGSELGVQIISTQPTSSEDFHISFPLINEKVDAKAGIQNINLLVTFLATLDIDKIKKWQIANLLNSSHYLRCLRSVSNQFAWTQLELFIGNLISPILNGFISQGVDQIVTSLGHNIAELYGDAFRTIIPNFVGTQIREQLNEISDRLEIDPTESTCPTFAYTHDENKTVYIDFRDLILDQSDAIAAGATGSQPYGDMTQLVVKGIEYITEPDGSGYPYINDAIIKPLTGAQSNILGTYFIAKEGMTLFETNSTSFGSLRLDVFDTRVENLDSFGYPFHIMQPRADFPHIIDNKAIIGVDSKPFRIASRFILDTDFMNTYNEFDVSLEARNLEISASVMAKLRELPFMTFPLVDLLNLNCWLATIEPPILDELGFPITEDDIDAKITGFTISMEELILKIECRSCTSEGFAYIPKLLSLMDSTGLKTELTQDLTEVLKEMILREGSQIGVARLLNDASKLCPHTSQFDPSFVKGEFNYIELERISRKSLETLVFTGIMFLEGLAVVTGMSLPSDTTTDPLSAQATLLLEEIKPIDFKDFENPLSGFINRVFKGVRDVMGEMSLNGNDLSINSILRTNFLDSDGSYSFQFTEASKTPINLESIILHGLDTIISFDVLHPIAPQTLQSKIKLEKLKIDMNLGFHKSSQIKSFDTNLTIDEIKENTTGNLTVSLIIEDVEVNFALLLVIEESVLLNLNLGSFLHFNDILSCLFSSLDKLEITQLNVAFSKVPRIEMNGFSSNDMKVANSAWMKEITEEFESDLINRIPFFFDSIVRKATNDYIQRLLSDSSDLKCHQHTNWGTDFIDLRNLLFNENDAFSFVGVDGMPYGDLFATAYDYIYDIFIAPDNLGLPGINDALIRPLTRSQSNTSGSLYFDGELFRQSIFLNETVSIDDVLEFQLHDLKLQNLDNVGYPFTILQPQLNESYSLENRASFNFTDRPLIVSTRVVFALQGDAADIFNEMIIHLELSKPSIFLPILLKIEEQLLFQIPLQDIFNPYCWLASIPGPNLNEFGIRTENSTDVNAAILDLGVVFDNIIFDIECVQCSGVGFKKLEELLATEDGRKGSRDFAYQLFNYTVDLILGDLTQNMIDRLLNEAVILCPYRNVDSKVVDEYVTLQNSLTFQDSLIITIALGGFLSLLLVSILLTRYCLILFAKNRLDSLPDEKMQEILGDQNLNEKKEIELQKNTKAIFQSKEVPLLIRSLIPLIILGNIGLFLSGHLNLGARVGADIIVAGQKVIINDFFEFTIAESIADMWEEGLKSLAVIIFICSMLWPYIKQSITLLLWFAPPTKISVIKRGIILENLDSLGKWSMLDIYVLIITLVVFRISIKNSEELPEDLYSLDLMVVPLWGLYANAIAQVLSQISSHFIIGYHRKIVSVGLDQIEGANISEENDEMADAIPLRKHLFNSSSLHYGRQMKIRHMCNVLILLIVVSLIFLFPLGCALPSFRLEILGLAGKAIDIGNDKIHHTQYHSLFTMVGVIMDQSSYLGALPHRVGLTLLCILFVATSLIVPVLQALSLCVLWFFSLTEEHKNRIVSMIEILQAWQYVEVFVISTFLGMWQIGDVSEIMVADLCEPLDGVFASLAHFNVLSATDARCFHAFSKMGGGAHILILASIMLSGLSHFVLSARKQQKENIRKQFDLKSSTTWETNSASHHEDEGIDETTKSLSKAPRPDILFTDIYRCFLNYVED